MREAILVDGDFSGERDVDPDAAQVDGHGLDSGELDLLGRELDLSSLVPTLFGLLCGFLFVAVVVPIVVMMIMAFMLISIFFISCLFVCTTTPKSYSNKNE